MRPIDTERLVRLDEKGAISDEPVLQPGEHLLALTAEDVELLRTELGISAGAIAVSRHRHALLKHANSQYGTRPGYVDELEAREIGLRLLQAGLPEPPPTDI